MTQVAGTAIRHRRHPGLPARGAPLDGRASRRRLARRPPAGGQDLLLDHRFRRSRGRTASFCHAARMPIRLPMPRRASALPRLLRPPPAVAAATPNQRGSHDRVAQQRVVRDDEHDEALPVRLRLAHDTRQLAQRRRPTDAVDRIVRLLGKTAPPPPAGEARDHGTAEPAGAARTGRRDTRQVVVVPLPVGRSLQVRRR